MHFDQFLSYFVEFMHLLQRLLHQIHKQNRTELSVLGQSSPNPWGDFGTACNYKYYSV